MGKKTVAGKFWDRIKLPDFKLIWGKGGGMTTRPHSWIIGLIPQKISASLLKK